MKPSHTQTPRTLADCTFTQGYTSIQPMAYRTHKWERFADYGLAVLLGVALATFLFLGLS